MTRELGTVVVRLQTDIRVSRDVPMDENKNQPLSLSLSEEREGEEEAGFQVPQSAA